MAPPFPCCLGLFWAALYLLVVLVLRPEPPEGSPVLAFRMPPQPLYLEYLRRAVAFCRREGVVLEATVTTRGGGHGLAHVEARGLWTVAMRDELDRLFAGCPRDPATLGGHPEAAARARRPRVVSVRLHRQEPAWFVDLFLLCLAEGIEFTGTYDSDPKARSGWSVRTDGLEPRLLQRVERMVRARSKEE